MHGRPTPMLAAVMDINAHQRARAVEILRRALGDREDAVVAVLGLTFKPDTDDLRGSPSLDVIGQLLEFGVSVRAHDPQGMAQARLLLPQVHYGASADDAIAGADAVLLATAWPEYLQLDWPGIRQRMRGNMVLDGRNALDGAVLTAIGFSYRSFGRPQSGDTGRKPSALPRHADPRSVPADAPQLSRSSSSST